MTDPITPPSPAPDDRSFEAPFGLGVDASGRLVEHQEVGIAQPHPGERQQQCHGVIGDLVETAVRDEGDEQPALRGGRDVEVVVADPVARDDPPDGTCARCERTAVAFGRSKP